MASDTHLAQEQVNDVEDHVEREFCGEERKEPLGGIHVCLEAYIQEVVVQVGDAFLKRQTD